MKKEKDINTEQVILAAAEKVFIEKGFAATKTTEIAKEAGVTHAMLHYYFRTKENLFNIVFTNKVRLLAESFFSVVEKGKSFTDIVRLGVEQHFDFIKNNSKLGVFIINEINSNERSSKIWNDIALPVFSKVVPAIEKLMDEEAEKGTIRWMDALLFVQTVVSLNIFPAMAQPLLRNIRHMSDEELAAFIEARKKENVRLALLALQP